MIKHPATKKIYLSWIEKSMFTSFVYLTEECKKEFGIKEFTLGITSSCLKDYVSEGTINLANFPFKVSMKNNPVITWLDTPEACYKSEYVNLLFRFGIPNSNCTPNRVLIYKPNSINIHL